MQGMTKIQREIVEYILHFNEVHGYPPSVREMGDHFGWTSSNAGSDHMHRMQRKGYIHITPKISRGIRVTPEALAYLKLYDETGKEPEPTQKD